VKRILFVCTGNTCRSPMAEGLARQMAKERGADLEFRSAGVSAADGQAISRHAVRILQEAGVSEELVSRRVTGESVAWAHLILAMTQGHKRRLIEEYPEAADKIFTLKEYADDNPENAKRMEEAGRLAAEAQLKLALGEKISPGEERKLQEMQINLPRHDISDPFGLDYEAYRQCAEEIRECLDKIMSKLG